LVAGYARPPITEAVIDFGVGTPLAPDLLDKFRLRLKPNFPKSIENKSYNVNINFDTGKAQVDAGFLAFRVSSDDEMDIRVLSRSNFVLSRLAPYPGWEEFSAKARRDWEIWKDLSHTNKYLSRIGVRFINRLDIPEAHKGKAKLEDYLAIGFRLPSRLIDVMDQFSGQFLTKIGDDKNNFGAIINIASAPSPLALHKSIILDIDIYRDSRLPQSDDDLWKVLGIMRDHKNMIFESCITDKARKMFESGSNSHDG
jgi:uncharacterized protein (TIGR04255 family)